MRYIEPVAVAMRVNIRTLQQAQFKSVDFRTENRLFTNYGAVSG